MKIPRKQFDASVPSMAMGDIAFLLLIFFVILARAQDDSHLQWEPAKAKQVQAIKNVKASVVIDIKNNTYLNGNAIGVGQLATEIESLLDESTVAKERMVLLKVHREVTSVYFEPVLEAIAEAGGMPVHVLEKVKQ